MTMSVLIQQSSPHRPDQQHPQRQRDRDAEQATIADIVVVIIHGASPQQQHQAQRERERQRDDEERQPRVHVHRGSFLPLEDVANGDAQLALDVGIVRLIRFAPTAIEQLRRGANARGLALTALGYAGERAYRQIRVGARQGSDVLLILRG